jgi:hypothetical protein
MRTSSSLSLAVAAAALAVAGSAHAVPETLGLSARIVDGGTPVTGPQTIVVRITIKPAAAPRCGPSR